MIRSILHLNRRTLFLTQQYSTVKPYEVAESEEKDLPSPDEVKQRIDNKSEYDDNNYFAEQLASYENYSTIKRDIVINK